MSATYHEQMKSDQNINTDKTIPKLFTSSSTYYSKHQMRKFLHIIYEKVRIYRRKRTKEVIATTSSIMKIKYF